jgi:outer membrane lipoprotein-sorting protein
MLDSACAASLLPEQRLTLDPELHIYIGEVNVMTKEFVQKVLKEDAESNRTGSSDLWPAIHGRLPQSGTPQLQPRRRLPVRLGLAPLALAGVLVVALLGLGLLMPSTLTQPARVSAAELLARAEQATSEGNGSSMRSFHGVHVAEQRNSATEEFSDARDEQWYLAPNKYRSDAHIRTRAGEEAVLMWVSNGKTGWKYDSSIGEVQPLRPQELKVRFGADSMKEMLGGVMVKSFYNIEVVGSETVDGRPAHIVELTVKPENEWPPNMYPSEMARSRLWVDAEAFFIARLQAWDAAGNVLSTSHYESYEINGTVDPEVFNVQPPASSK